MLTDSGVRERVAHYLSCSNEDADSLRDVISQRDLTGVDEIIVRCPASPHSPRPYSGTPSPNMPRPGERKLNGSSRTSPAHKSRIPSHSSSLSYRGAAVKVQQNGVDSNSGKSGMGDEDCPPSKRQDRGFETFVMTGDMIIRTSTTSSHSKTESTRKPASDKRKGSGEGRSLKSPQSPVKSPQNDTPKDSKTKSRIPKPGRVSSPKQTPSQIPRPGWSEKKLNRSANYNSSTDSESTEHGLVSPTAGHIENLEVVNNNVIEPMADIPCQSVARIEDLPKDMGPTKAEPVEIEYYSHYPPPAYTIAPELDIPPDDISSEDDNYKNMEIIMNLDDLPPPPDELLHDYPEKVEDSVPVRIEPVIPAATALLAEGSLPPREGEAGQAASDQTMDEQNRLVISKSAEKILPRSNSQNASGVRTSKSHENYLESQNMMGVTMVDIDLDDNLASSVDVLHYQEKLSSSAEHVTETSRSLENSPQCSRHAERHHIPTFIRIEETRVEPVAGQCLRRPLEAALQEERPVSTSSTASVNSDLSRELVGVTGPEAGTESQEELVQNGLLLERLHRQSRDLEDVTVPADTELMVNNHNNHHQPPPEEADSPAKSETSSTAGHVDHNPGTPHSSPSHQEAESPSQTVIAAANPGGAGSPPAGSPVGSPRPRSDTMGSEGSESDNDSLYHQPSKDVDRPSAQRLAKRLYQLDGFKKGDVFRHLSKK